MPVMIVGADSPTGRRIAERLFDPAREVRVFVTDPEAAEEWRSTGAKVALGDVSDDTHVAGACLNCFSVVLVGEAATDSRTRSFASTPAAVMTGWANAVGSAGVRRVIWVIEGEPPATSVPEVAVVHPATDGLADEVYGLDSARRI